MPMRAALLALTLLLGPLASGPAAQDAEEPASFVINLRDADIRALAEQVSEITGRTLVLDPAVEGEVTVISAQPLDEAEVWELFLSVLRVQGFAALRSGSIWRVIPEDQVREGGGGLEDPEATGRLDVVTRLVQLSNFPATTAATALRPLVATFGYIEALPETNALVVTDVAENVSRIEEIARQLDAGNGDQVNTIFLRNADAAELAAGVQEVFGGEDGAPAPQVAVDPRSNALLVRGSPEQVAEVRRIAENLDQPGRQGPSLVPVTRVYRLQFADAASLAEILSGVIGAQAVATSPIAEALGQPEPEIPETAAEGVGIPVALAGEPAVAVPPPVISLAAEEISVQPAPDINAVVVRARAEVQADLAQLIAQLDQRRPQVLIEAVIAEISGDISQQLGVQLGFGTATPPGGFAATSFSPTGPSLANILTLLGSPARVATSPAGLSVALARGDEFGVLIQALASSSRANLLSTPSITTLDNQPAEIVVAQNVPFRTGSFLTEGGPDNPFTTIERQDVGLTLRVVPRVSEGNVVQLEVSQEVSSLVGAVAGAADLITNRRLIQTTVLADNGGTIVLGGLITDDRSAVESEVPGLGRVPVLGRLFGSESRNSTKRTLFVFLRPTILRTRADIDVVSSNSFRRLRSIEAPPSAPASPTAASPAPAPRPVERIPVEIDGLY